MNYPLIAMATTILLLMGIIYFGYKEITALNERLGAVQTSLAVTEKTLDVIRDNTAKNQTLIAEYSDKLKALTSENARFRKSLEGMKIWTLDPTTSEPIVNKTFNDLLAGIQTSTGVSGEEK